LRGEESERDERFVKELAHQLNVAVQIKRFDTQREMELSKKALEKHRGTRKAAADELGISERTLYRKIKEYKFG
jgi:transcriptional regulator with PAS, ATPase and Fis domain